MTETSERGYGVWVPESVTPRARMAFIETLEHGRELTCAWCEVVIVGPVGTTTNARPIHYNACPPASSTERPPYLSEETQE